MSAQHTGISLLLHEAIQALHDGNKSLVEGNLLKALDLFHDHRLSHDELVRFAENEVERMNHEHRVEDGGGDPPRATAPIIMDIIERWHRYKPNVQ